MTTPQIGAWRPARLPDENAKAITALMRKVVESKYAAAVKEFTAVMYTSQLVNGTNYIIKVLVDPAIARGCFHLHIHQPLPSKDTPVSYQLTNVEKGQTLGSPIVPLTQIIPPVIKPGPKTGAPTPPRLADAQVDGLTYQMKHAVEASTGVRYLEFKPIMYTTQVVAGLNYSIKVQVDPLVRNSCIIVNVFESLPTKELQLAYHLSSVQPEVPLDYDMTPLKPLRE